MAGSIKAENLVILVDGQNFISQIRKLFLYEIKPEDYLPRNADWRLFFESIAKMLGAKSLSVYFYTIKELDYLPHIEWDKVDFGRFSHKDYEQWKKHLLRKNAFAQLKQGRRVSFAEKDFFDQKNYKTRKRVIEKWRRICFENYEEMESRLEEWHELQDNVRAQYPNFFPRRTGWQLCRLVDKHLHTEKGVDIGLATDMVFLRPHFDTALLFTSDGDYVPLVEALQKHGKTIGIVEYKIRTGETLKGTARRLSEIADFTVDIPFEAMKTFMRIETKPYAPKPKESQSSSIDP